MLLWVCRYGLGFAALLWGGFRLMLWGGFRLMFWGGLIAFDYVFSWVCLYDSGADLWIIVLILFCALLGC